MSANTQDEGRAISTEPEDQWDDCNVICPYCLNEYQAEAESYTDQEVKETCDECGQTYLRSDDFTVTHNTRPLPKVTPCRE